MRITRNKVIVSAVAVAFMLSTASPANATNAGDDRSATDVHHEVTGTAGGTWVDRSGYVRLSAQQLAELDSEQSASETQRIADSGEAVNMLVDPDTGRVLAAQYAELSSPATPLAITDCGSGGSIIKRRNQGVTNTYCYIGSGTRIVSIVGTYYASAGASNIHLTLHFTNGTSTTLLHGSSITLSTPKTTNKLVRGYHA